MEIEERGNIFASLEGLINLYAHKDPISHGQLCQENEEQNAIESYCLEIDFHHSKCLDYIV